MPILKLKKFPFLKHAIVLSASTLLISACSTPGDFGRPRKSFFLDTVNDEVTGVFEADQYIIGDVDDQGRYKGRKFSLTPDELELRDIARHFKEPLAEDRFLPVPDTNKEETRYAESLTKQHHYGPARMGVIASQIDADRKKLEQFEALAIRIKQADQSREDVLSRPNPMLSNRDRIRAVSRIEENEQVIHAVFRDIQGRLASYAYAVERSKLETPGQIASQAEPALALLRERAATAQSQFDSIARDHAMRRKMVSEAYGTSQRIRPMKGASEQTGSQQTGSEQTGSVIKYYNPHKEGETDWGRSLVKKGSYQPPENQGDSSENIEPLISKSKRGL